MTKKSADINYISKDLFPKTYNRTMIDDDYIKQLEQQVKNQKEVIDKINNYIDNYDIFKVFSFPLMKRWEEEQVKSSIDYEFKISLIKDLKEILEDKEVSK